MGRPTQPVAVGAGPGCVPDGRNEESARTQPPTNSRNHAWLVVERYVDQRVKAHHRVEGGRAEVDFFGDGHVAARQPPLGHERSGPFDHGVAQIHAGDAKAILS
jgi:hypothetical protein